MTSLVIDAEPRGRAFEKLLARDMNRLRDPDTGLWMHLSGCGTTTDVTWSWLGHRHQARALRARWEAEGRAWTFQPLHRDDCETTPSGALSAASQGDAPVGLGAPQAGRRT